VNSPDQRHSRASQFPEVILETLSAESSVNTIPGYVIMIRAKSIFGGQLRGPYDQGQR
jgi:hypothetical protein